MWVWQTFAEAGGQFGTRDQLAAIARSVVCAVDPITCPRFDDVAQPLCHGRAACQAALLVPLADGQMAFIPDVERGNVTVVEIGRADDHPSTTRYGGSTALLTSILSTFDVYPPEPGQIPAGS